MNTITVQLNDPSTRQFVEKVISSGEYDSAEGYVLGLIALDCAEGTKKSWRHC